MKNALGKEENLTLFNEQGVKVYKFVIDSNGLLNEMIYDSSGNQLTYKDSNGLIIERTYDKKDKQSTHKDSDGAFWRETDNGQAKRK